MHAYLRFFVFMFAKGVVSCTIAVPCAYLFTLSRRIGTQGWHINTPSLWPFHRNSPQTSSFQEAFPLCVVVLKRENWPTYFPSIAIVFRQEKLCLLCYDYSPSQCSTMLPWNIKFDKIVNKDLAMTFLFFYFFHIPSFVPERPRALGVKDSEKLFKLLKLVHCP